MFIKINLIKFNLNYEFFFDMMHIKQIVRIFLKESEYSTKNHNIP